MDVSVQFNAMLDEVRQQRDILAQRCVQLASELALMRAALSTLHAQKNNIVSEQNAAASREITGEPRS